MGTDHTWSEQMERTGRRFAVAVTAEVTAGEGRRSVALRSARDASGYDWAPSLSSLEEQVFRSRALEIHQSAEE
jgi:hypothetical protein